MSKSAFYVLNIFLTLFFSCQTPDKNPIAILEVVETDYDDILKLDGFIDPVKSTSITCPSEIDGKVIFIIEDGMYVQAGDVVCLIEDKNLENRYDEMVARLDNAQANLVKTKANLTLQLAMLEAQVKTNLAETAIANLDSLQLMYASENQRKIKKLELRKRAIEKQKFDKKLRAMRFIQNAQIRRSEMEIQRITTRVQASKDKLESLKIKAPQSGLALRGISFISGRKLTEGDPIWEGMPILTIPELKIMKVMISASEGNYKRINVGDAVEYTFDAMPNNAAWGKILKKAPVGQPIKKDSKVKFFEIEATVDSSIIVPAPGLSTQCKVILKRISNAIVIPQVAIFEDDSMKVVFVKSGEGFQQRQILTGASSPKEAVVINGLMRNEKISLTRPIENLIISKKILPISKAIKSKINKKKASEKPEAIKK